MSARSPSDDHNGPAKVRRTDPGPSSHSNSNSNNTTVTSTAAPPAQQISYVHQAPAIPSAQPTPAISTPKYFGNYITSVPVQTGRFAANNPNLLVYSAESPDPALPYLRWKSVVHFLRDVQHLHVRLMKEAERSTLRGEYEGNFPFTAGAHFVNGKAYYATSAAGRNGPNNSARRAFDWPKLESAYKVNEEPETSYNQKPCRHNTEGRCVEAAVWEASQKSGGVTAVVTMQESPSPMKGSYQIPEIAVDRLYRIVSLNQCEGGSKLNCFGCWHVAQKLNPIVENLENRGSVVSDGTETAMKERGEYEMTDAQMTEFFAAKEKKGLIPIYPVAVPQATTPQGSSVLTYEHKTAIQPAHTQSNTQPTAEEKSRMEVNRLAAQERLKKSQAASAAPIGAVPASSKAGDGNAQSPAPSPMVIQQQPTPMVAAAQSTPNAPAPSLNPAATSPSSATYTLPTAQQSPSSVPVGPVATKEAASLVTNEFQGARPVLHPA